MDAAGKQYATQSKPDEKGHMLQVLYAKPRLKFVYVSLHMCVSVYGVQRSQNQRDTILRETRKKKRQDTL